MRAASPDVSGDRAPALPAQRIPGGGFGRGAEAPSEGKAVDFSMYPIA